MREVVSLVGSLGRRPFSFLLCSLNLDIDFRVRLSGTSIPLLPYAKVSSKGLDAYAFQFSKQAGLTSKIQRTRILESVKAGKRLPEARLTTLKIARQAQGIVHDLFSSKKKNRK